MIEKTTYMESGSTCPYHNLALESYLLGHCKENECILYLWQNANTIVIGRNQNAWKECLVDKLKEENGHLARRLSGGGAVYHDLGNLNFTFLVSKKHYSVEKQLDVILRAVRRLGIPAEKSGRNDILADGRKFSGNAYYEQGGRCYHHGTLMVDVNMSDLSRYLTVSREKLQAKGVDSVRSRVVNLSEFVPGLHIGQLKESLLETFQEVYGIEASIRKEEEIDAAALLEAEKRFASWDWLYGKKFAFQHQLEKRFPWGDILVQLQVEKGRITDAAVYSDAMKPDIMLELPKYFKGCRYDRRALAAELGLYWSADPQENEMSKDIIAWLLEAEL